jgi:hypothetical protein
VKATDRAKQAMSGALRTLKWARLDTIERRATEAGPADHFLPAEREVTKGRLRKDLRKVEAELRRRHQH